MYKKNIFRKTELEINDSTEGEPIQLSIERLLNNGEDMEEMTEKGLVYTERDLGVIQEYDIRADKFDIAIENTERVTNSMRGNNEKRRKERADALEKLKNKSDSKGENKEGGDAVNSATSE